MTLLVNGRKFSVHLYHIVTFILMAVFAYIVASDLQYNTAFVDEAIYANVGEEFMRGAYWDAPLSWMGGSYAYPILSANINRLWGLWGIRLAAMTMVLVTAWCVGWMGKKLAGHWGRPLAIGFFLFSAPTLGVAQLATYDAPSMMTFTLGSVALMLGSEATSLWKKYLLTALSGILVGGSFLIKYVIVLVSVPLTLMNLIAKRHWFLGGLLWAWLILAIVLPYGYINLTDLQSYATGGHSIENVPRMKIFMQMMQQMPAMLIGLVATMVLLAKTSQTDRKKQMLIMLLIGLAPIAYHLGSGNIRSFNKHLSLASVMWAPLTAWTTITIWKIYKKYQQTSGLIANSMQLLNSVALIAIFTSVWTAFSIHWMFERSWPSANETVAYLDQHLETGDRVFAEGAATYKYHLFRGFGDPSAWPSTWYYERDGIIGTQAMKDAIQAREFRYVILNNYFTSETNREILPSVKENYRPVMEEKYLLSGVHENITTVWERKPKSKFGFFDLLVSTESSENKI